MYEQSAILTRIYLLPHKKNVEPLLLRPNFYVFLELITIQS